MARSAFGGTSVDWLVKPYSFGSVQLVALETDTNTLNFYSAKTAGTHYTDLLDEDSQAVTAVTVEGHEVPRFEGPDGILGMWADKGDGSPREFMEARDLAAAADVLVDAETFADAAADSATEAAEAAAAAATTGLPLVFDRTSPDGNQEIYRSRLDGGDPTRITDDTDWDSWWPKISPDGTRILFLRVSRLPTPLSSYDSDYTVTGLWVMNPDGSDATQIVADATYDYLGTPNWHPDGSRIVFFGGTGANQIRTIRPDGTDFQTVSVTGISTGVTDTCYTPDGSAILFAYLSDIWIVPVAGGFPQQLTTDGASTPNFDPAPDPTGRLISMLTRTATVDGGHPAGQYAIRTMRITGGTITTVLSNGDANSKQTWGPDGRFYFHRYVQIPSVAGYWSLAAACTDGTGLTAISSTAVRHGFPDVLPVTPSPVQVGRPILYRGTSYSMLATDSIIMAIPSGNGMTVSLPDPATVPPGRSYIVKMTSAFTLTVNSQGSGRVLDGSASQSLTQWQKAEYFSDGNHWYTI